MTPEFDTNLSLAMLSVKPLAMDKSPGVDLSGLAPLPSDGNVKFGEGPAGWPPPLSSLLQPAAQVALEAAQIEDEMDRTQESIVAALYTHLEAAGINRSERLVISLAANGQVEVGDHPQREQVLAVLTAHPAVVERMKFMAALALAERGMSDISLANQMVRGATENGERIFQACLKGGLSHFHLV